MLPGGVFKVAMVKQHNQDLLPAGTEKPCSFPASVPGVTVVTLSPAMLLVMNRKSKASYLLQSSGLDMSLSLMGELGEKEKLKKIFP